MHASLRWFAIALVSTLLMGCPFEQIEFDPYARHFECAGNIDCLDDQFCSEPEPKVDSDGAQIFDEDGEITLHRICKPLWTPDAGTSPSRDDAGPDTGPGSPSCEEGDIEVCDELDNDCDGRIDEDEVCDAVDVPTPEQAGSAYVVNECSADDPAGVLTPVEAYRSPSAEICPDWSDQLTSEEPMCTFPDGRVALPASCAEVQPLLISQDLSLSSGPEQYWVKVGSIGNERRRKALCVGYGQDMGAATNSASSEIAGEPLLGWEIANRNQNGVGSLRCVESEDCPEFFRCDAATGKCVEAVGSDTCHNGENGILLRDVSGGQLGYEEEYELCQRSTENRADDMNLQRTLGIRNKSLTPFSNIWAKAPVARCALVWRRAPAREQARLDFLRVTRQALDDGVLSSPLGELKVSIQDKYHIRATDNGGGYEFTIPTANHAQVPGDIEVSSASSSPDDPDPVLKVVRKTIPEGIQDDTEPHVIAYYLELSRPIDLGCVVRDARALTFNFQFDVRLPGACGEGLAEVQGARQVFCDLDDPDSAAQVCGGRPCTADALNLQWVCSLNMSADTLIRPQIIGTPPAQ